jgi:hypothetical protein
MTRLIAITVATVGLTLVSASTGGVTDTVTFHATLRGTSEVPKGDPDGRGSALVTFQGAKVCWNLRPTGIGTPIAAHIHKGAAGVAGPVVLPFGKSYKAKGCVTTTQELATALEDTLQKKPSAYYVNVHTRAYKAGAVRGQLRK